MPHSSFVISTGLNTLIPLLIRTIKLSLNDFDHISALKSHNILNRILRIIIIEIIFNLIIRSESRHHSHSLLFSKILIIVVRFFWCNNQSWCCSIGGPFVHFWQYKVGAAIRSGPCEGERGDLIVVHGCERVCMPKVCETKRWDHIFCNRDDIERFSIIF